MRAEKHQPTTTGIIRLRPTVRTTARVFVVTNKRKHKITKRMTAPTARCHSLPATKHDTVAKSPSLGSRYSDLLRAGRSKDRIPLGARFSSPVQMGPGTHPACCTKFSGSFLGVKRPGRGVEHPTRLVPSSKKV
jgi:hypothetical protein